MKKQTMLRSFLVLFSVLFCFYSVQAQINIQWESRLDGAGSFTDVAVDLKLDASGNTYVVGTSFSGTSFDIVTVKYDPDGTELWSTSYGGVGIDEARGIVLDGDNNVIITGSRFTGGSDFDIVTIKYDGDTGAELWEVINTGSSNFDFPSDIAIDNLDNVIVVGSINIGSGNNDFTTIKYNSSGTLLWSDSFGGTGSDDAKLVETDAAGNVYVAGHHEFSPGSTFFDFRLVKYNSAGIIQWSVTEDSDFGNLDTPNAITLDGSGDIILGGSGFTDIINEEDYLTMKFTNATGALQWKRIYAGDAEGVDVVNAVSTNTAGDVFVTGRSQSMATAEDYYTIAYDDLGTELWADRFSTEGLEFDEATDLMVAPTTGNVYVTGYSFFAATNNDVTTLRYDGADGSRVWTTIFDGPSSNSDQAVKMELDPTENIYITGNSHGGATNLDYSTIKYCQLTTEASADTAICIGESVMLSATGGDDITWDVISGDMGSLSCTLCEDVNATPDETSVYTVSSTSLSGCIDFDTVTVTVNELPVPVILHDTPLEFCSGDSVVLYSNTFSEYDWSTGSTDSLTVVFAGGTYDLTVIDSNGCTNMVSETVVVFDLPVVEVGDDISICPEETVSLIVTGAVTYVWDFNSTLSVLLGATTNATPVADTEYFVTGTDDNGCENRDSITISLFDLPVVNAGADENVCVGDSVMLNATGAVTYLWNTDPTLSDLDIPNPYAFPTTIKEYFVVGTDDNGCSNIDSVIVSTTSLPNIDAGEDTIVCVGESVQLFVSGGLPDMYIWNADVTLSETDVFNPFATPVIGTDYIVEGTDINGCSNRDTVFVEVNALPMVNAGPDEAICLGDSVQFDASGAVVYTWDSDPSLSALDINDPWASPISTRDYTVTGVDANGCVNSDDITVVVNEIPIVSAGPDLMVCLGDSVMLNATGGDIYVWDFDPTLSNFLISNPYASPTSTTIYNVEVTDSEGCSNTDEVVVTVNPLPIPPVLVVDSVFIISSFELGNQWVYEGSLLIGETDDSLNYLDIGMNGEYWVIYTDDLGCSAPSNRIENPIIIENVGIEEEEITFNVNLYPNPTRLLVYLDVDQEIDAVIIRNIQGQILRQYENIAPGVQEMNFEDLSKGTYLVQLIKEDQILTKKIIKQ